MKKVLVAITCMLAALSAYGQGQVNFNNFVSGQVNAPVLGVDGQRINGANEPNARAGLWVGTTADNMVLVGDAVGFQTGSRAGLVAVTPTTSARTVAGIAGGQAAKVQVRAWIGASFASATVRGQSAILDIVLKEPPDAPPNLIGLTSFQLTVIPEPSTIALGVLGAGALLMLRRRK